MRSHVTREIERRKRDGAGFQYRKRYEVTCDMSKYNEGLSKYKFQYRKRYEVTCDRLRSQTRSICRPPFQYRKRYEVTCDFDVAERVVRSLFSFNTASGMRSHATLHHLFDEEPISRFNTASGMRSHATLCLGGRRNRRLKSQFWKTSSKPNV